MGWLLILAGVVIVLSVFAWWPTLRGHRRGAPDGASEHVLREGDRAGGMQSGWGTGAGFGGPGAGGGY